MVFYGQSNSNRIKSQDLNSKPSVTAENTYNGSGNESSTEILLTPHVLRSNQTKVRIKTDLSQAHSIGFNVNTNVHLKPKKRFDCRNVINGLLFLILIAQGVSNYLEIQRLKSELKVMKLGLKEIEDSTTSVFDILKDTLKVIENDLQKSAINTGVQLKHPVIKRDVENRDIEFSCSNCSTSSAPRFARSVTRGKHSHCKSRNGCHSRCYRTSGPLALHLKGALPEISVRDGGIISPWYIDKSSLGGFILEDGIKGERKGVLEIAEEGLYFIYAQIYYLTSSSLNSYAINVQLGEGRGREDRVLAVCSAEAASSKLSELSCFTATVRYLHQGDRIFVTQRERNRRIIFRDSQSFLGLILLNSPNVMTK